MEPDHLFWLPPQSSFALGLIHGINPCGRSWLVPAPFVAGTLLFGAYSAFSHF